MPHGFRNWGYRDVCGFLKHYGFNLSLYLGGSHESWVNKKIAAAVEVNRTTGSYPPRTLETMIRQSKISEDIWRDWSGGKKHPRKQWIAATYRGVVSQESLRDLEVLKLVSLTGFEIKEIENAADGQPNRWTMHSFEVSEIEVESVARAFALALLEGKWYVCFKSDDDVCVIFPGKMFRYKNNDINSQSSIKEYASALGIPESQLDW